MCPTLTPRVKNKCPTIVSATPKDHPVQSFIAFSQQIRVAMVCETGSCGLGILYPTEIRDEQDGVTKDMTKPAMCLVHRIVHVH